MLFSFFSPEGRREGGRHALGQPSMIDLRVMTTWIIRGDPSPWPVMKLNKQTHNAYVPL